MRARLTFLFLFASTSLLAQTQVRGTVVDLESGRPIDGATITLQVIGQPASWVEGRSNLEGQFALALAFRGECGLIAEKIGFVDPLSRGRDGHRIRLGSESETAVTISLTRAAAVTGTVFDEAGRPVAGARVGPVVRDPVTGVPVLEEPQAVVDDRGHFGLYGLMPGSYILAVVPSQYVPTHDIFPPAYFPDTTQIERATRIHLVGGATQGPINFLIPRAGRLTVSGRIDSAPQRARVLVTLFAREAYGGPLASVFSEGGSFRFDGVSLGRYRIVASMLHTAGSPAGESWSGTSDTEVIGADVTDVIVEMRPPIALEGHFEFPAGKPRNPSCWSDAQIALRPAGAAPAEGPTLTLASPDGKFVLPPARPAQYRLTIDGLSGCYLEEVRHASASAHGSLVNPEQGAVTIIVTDKTSELSGKIWHGPNAASSATVVLAPLMPTGLVSPREAIIAAVASDGNYRFQTVAPGQYYAMALMGAGRSANWHDPAFWADHKNQTVLVSLHGGEQVQSDLKVLTILEVWR